MFEIITEVLNGKNGQNEQKIFEKTLQKQKLEGV
jgi:hypothetical protein